MAHAHSNRPLPNPPTKPAAVCSRWSADPCPATEGVRRYMHGYFCPTHAPASPTGPARQEARSSAPADNPLKATALMLAGRGWSVFPITPGSKKPPVVRDWEHRATTDPDRIARCWDHGRYNVGIATGPSGLVVVDLDKPKSDTDAPPAEWAEQEVADGFDVLYLLAAQAEQPYPGGTFTVATASGGQHLYFLAPDGIELRNSTGKLGWKIDTRAHGGYVVAPGSVTGAASYRVVNDVPPVPLPAWLLERLRPAPIGRGPVAIPLAHHGSGYAAAALHNETANVAGAPEGMRNATLVRAARALGRFVASGDLPRGVVEDALKAGASGAGLTERESVPAITSALNWSIAHNVTRAA
ncbi:bifunctional DNA primase/polymerase [Embleya sp. MST-111070]|uniref:bifunctional DNA primase/polymerase n=1 Tax=Embleya sp. MST-111070 TaxID=3398231 RepID=UPI003F73F624